MSQAVATMADDIRLESQQKVAGAALIGCGQRIEEQRLTDIVGAIAGASNQAIMLHYPFIRSSRYRTARAQRSGNGHSAR